MRDGDKPSDGGDPRGSRQEAWAITSCETSRRQPWGDFRAG
jgi:hypothetical protein